MRDYAEFQLELGEGSAITHSVAHGSPSILHCPLYFPACFTHFVGFPAVMLLLAFGQSDFDLSQAPIGKIDAERNDREPLLLRLHEELVDFLAMKKQFPRT